MIFCIFARKKKKENTDGNTDKNEVIADGRER